MGKKVRGKSADLEHFEASDKNKALKITPRLPYMGAQLSLRHVQESAIPPEQAKITLTEAPNLPQSTSEAQHQLTDANVRQGQASVEA